MDVKCCLVESISLKQRNWLHSLTFLINITQPCSVYLHVSIISYGKAWMIQIVRPGSCLIQNRLNSQELCNDLCHLERFSQRKNHHQMCRCVHVDSSGKVKRQDKQSYGHLKWTVLPLNQFVSFLLCLLLFYRSLLR